MILSGNNIQISTAYDLLKLQTYVNSSISLGTVHPDDQRVLIAIDQCISCSTRQGEILEARDDIDVIKGFFGKKQSEVDPRLISKLMRSAVVSYSQATDGGSLKSGRKAVSLWKGAKAMENKSDIVRARRNALYAHYGAGATSTEREVNLLMLVGRFAGDRISFITGERFEWAYDPEFFALLNEVTDFVFDRLGVLIEQYSDDINDYVNALPAGIVDAIRTQISDQRLAGIETYSHVGTKAGEAFQAALAAQK